MAQNKRILIGVSVLALITLIVGLVWWFMPPGKSDFAAAKTTAEKIAEYKGTTLFREYAGVVSGAGKEGKSYAQIVEGSSNEKKKLFDTLNSRSENAVKLESSRVLRDKDVKSAYNTYITQEKKYDTYLRSYADAYPAFMSSFHTCDKVIQITRQTRDMNAYAGLHKQAAQDCLSDLSLLSKASNEPLVAYAKEFTRIVNGRQKAFDDLAAGTATTDATLTSIKELSADLAKNDPTDKLAALAKGASFNGELNNLIKVLGEKAEQAK